MSLVRVEIHVIWILESG